MWAIDKCSMNSPYSQEKELINAIAIIYVVCWLLTAFQIMPIANTIHGFGAFTGLLFGLLHARIQGDQYSWRWLQNANERFNFVIILALLIGGVIVDLFFSRI